ncbi:MAG: ferric reductase-like transmembrane domain-containing protein [Candidatus Aenigmatarchaeota archaeon]
MKKIYIHAAFFILFILTYFLVKILSPQERLITSLVSTFGFISLILIIIILSLPLFVKYKNTSLTRYLLSERRWIGIYTFIFALIHFSLVFYFFFGLDINKILNNKNRLYLSLGGIALLFLFLMTITSNNYSVRKLGKNWKRLHYLIYPALVLILIHSFNIGLIYMKNFWLKIIVLIMILIIILLKFYKSKKSK